MNLKLIQKKIRKEIIKLSYSSKTSHLGSSLSCVDVMLVLYKFFIKKKNTFILSKGHACLAYYCILKKFNFISSKTLNSYGKNNSILMGHSSHKVPGIEFSTGSLGHGLPYATGRALAEKINKTNNNIYVLISDGELNEGTTWESLMFASYHKLNNLFVIVDYNKIQSLDFTKNILKLEPLNAKFKSFNCETKIINGHNLNEIYKSLFNKNKNKPNVIIANTVKGKGVSFMENKIIWHYKNPSLIDLNLAIRELS
jgi:transketolase